MIPNMPTIGVRFDIEKAGGGYYGFACWKVFWQAIHPKEIGVASLYEGDTAATLNGRENVFCIAVQSLDSAAAARIKAALRLFQKNNCPGALAGLPNPANFGAKGLDLAIQAEQVGTI